MVRRSLKYCSKGAPKYREVGNGKSQSCDTGRGQSYVEVGEVGKWVSKEGGRRGGPHGVGSGLEFP